MNSYAARVLAALAIDKPAESIRAIKDTVQDELAQLDRRAEIVRTDFFNHSFAPDFVLQWNGDGRANKRDVYLRFQSNRASLLQDMTLLAEESPIFFGIGDTQQEKPDPGEELQQRAEATDSLITNPDGIEHILDARESSPFLKVVCSTLGRAGRGLLDSPRASELAGSLSTAFTSARSLQSEDTASATRTLASILTPEYANPFLGFLRAVWIGSGGNPGEFPLADGSVARLADEALQFLLDLEEIDDDQFWWEVGTSITLDQLGKVRLEEVSENLQHLVRVAHPLMTARLCRILADQPRLEDELPRLYWVIERGLLALRGVNFSAYLAPRHEAMTVETEPTRGITLSALQRRTEDFRIPVGEVELAREDRSMIYGSEIDPDVIHDVEVGLLAEALGPAAMVQRAEASLPGGGYLQLDFKSLTASGRTSAVFPIRDILLASLGLLWSISSEDRAALDRLLPPSAAHQQMLDL